MDRMVAEYEGQQSLKCPSRLTASDLKNNWASGSILKRTRVVRDRALHREATVGANREVHGALQGGPFYERCKEGAKGPSGKLHESIAVTEYGRRFECFCGSQNDGVREHNAKSISLNTACL